MIRHLVLFKLNEGVAKDDPRALEGAAMFEALGGKIEQLREWQCGWNVSPRDNAYDFAINSLVEDEAGLTGYATHPDHLAAVDHWRSIATWVIADFHV
ncbi:Dabb family protein [Streptacidiphilus monticola]|jgi:hypothetical protein|uniref:Dabb family protein n=1 Tax=Streptacidiphilus monticola TaxID=2161674 RepID=A0ABW1G3I9_9ACTN